MQIFQPSSALLGRVGFAHHPNMIFSIPSYDFREGDETASAFSISLVKNIISSAKLIYRKRFSNEHIQSVTLHIFLEQLRNFSEHGNKLDPKKLVTVGLWFGEKGILFAFRDQGNFFSKESTKKAFESRTKIPTSRKSEFSGGIGISLLYEASDEIFVATHENTLYATYLL